MDDGLLVQQGDRIYLRGNWDGSPVIVEEFKLVFFTVAKVGCTVWKQLFRRMMGYKNWQKQHGSDLPWNPELNGLKYLYDYNRGRASEIMTDPSWTRAIFVRDPKERFLSAYLDKVVGKNNNNNGRFVRSKCCPSKGKCVPKSLQEFINVAQTCDDHHWTPQSRRMEDKYWAWVNFVGHMENAADDARNLLERVGAWERYGRSGWGRHGNESIFSSSATATTGRKHATNAKNKLRLHYNNNNSARTGNKDTTTLEGQVEAYYAQDYSHPVLNLTNRPIFA